MKKDIQSITDIEVLVNKFYDKVKVDNDLSAFFSNVNWGKHLPIMYKFWENIVFHTGGYEGNPMNTHQKLHQKSPTALQHFQKWNQLFTQTVDELFEGEKAELIKQRALSISTVMQIKIFN